MSYSCLLVGLGQISMGYDLSLDSEFEIYTHARAISIHPEFELVGAVDPISAKREIFTKNFKLPAFDNLTEALHNTSPSIIIIASPTIFHLELVSEVLKLCKPEIILCEKPLAYEIKDARKIVELCKNAKVKLFVNYIRRSDPGAIEIKKRLRGQKDVKGVAWYSKGFIHNGSHLFNLLEFWLGEYQNSTIVNSGRIWQEMDYEPDVSINFENGTVLFLSAMEEKFSFYTIELIGNWGRLNYQQGGEYITWQDTLVKNNFEDYKFLNITPEIISNRMKFYQLSVFEQLAYEMKNMKTTLCTGEEALLTSEAIHTIIKQRKS
jgi:predicted dehydrogenase